MGFFNGATRADIPSGTLMLFQQTAAPTGWTKQTTHDNKALRVVIGTAGSGGSTGFTTALGTPDVSVGSISIGATTLSVAQMPSHTHSYTASNSTNQQIIIGASGYGQGTSSANQGTFGANTGGAGSTSSHTHSVSGSGTASISVAYVDLIIASKS